MVQLWGKSPLKQDSFIHSFIHSFINHASGICSMSGHRTPEIDAGDTGVNKMDMVLTSVLLAV